MEDRRLSVLWVIKDMTYDNVIRLRNMRNHWVVSENNNNDWIRFQYTHDPDTRSIVPECNVNWQKEGF